MNIIVSAEDQKIILDELLDIPSEELKNLCDTSDRLETFNVAKYYCLMIREYLKCYFSGIKYNKDFYNEKDEYCFNLRMQGYLVLYNIIWHCWEDIKKDGFIKAHKLFNYTSYSFPSTPGNMLVEITNSECLGILSNVFPEWTTGNKYIEYSPRKEYENTNKLRKLDRELEKGDISDAKWKNFVRLYNKQVQNYRDNYIFLFYREMCLEIAKKNSSNYIKRNVIEFYELQQELIELEHSYRHPKNGMKAYKVSKGQKSYYK